MKIAFQPPALVLAGVDDALARTLQLLHASSQLDVQSTVFERDCGRGGDPVEQLGLVDQRRVVQQRRKVLSVAVDQRRRC